jgi:DNA-binding CsgD family transcriptional regulator
MAARLRAGFDRSRLPMLIADDHRRWITGNAAACELLGLSQAAIPWRAMDDFTPPTELERLEEQWAAFLVGGAAEGWYPLYVPERGAVPVEFSAIAGVLPGRHLTVFGAAHHETPPGVGSASAIAASWAPARSESAARKHLTKREREVITLVAAGGHNDDIAAQLFVSPETVKTHVQNAMAKVGAHTRAHAVAIALVTGTINWSTYDPSVSEAPGDDLAPSP